MAEERAYEYDHIPTLKELMPTTAGIPGVEYAQVATTNIRMAQDLGWGRICGNQKVYTITGPKGSVDCELYCKGTPIIGEDHKAGRRVCMVDKDIRAKTGLDRTYSKGVENPREVHEESEKAALKALEAPEEAPEMPKAEAVEVPLKSKPKAKKKAGRPKGSKNKDKKKKGTKKSVPTE
jgi:hypothetical protein